MAYFFLTTLTASVVDLYLAIATSRKLTYTYLFSDSTEAANTQSCGCTLCCFTNISEEYRKTLFHGFWKTGNFDIQNTYIPNRCVYAKLFSFPSLEFQVDV